MSNQIDMFYDEARNRWLVDLEGHLYGLHCGECFQLIIGPHPIPCRLEFDRHWFVVMEEVRMNLRIQDTYHVIM